MDEVMKVPKITIRKINTKACLDPGCIQKRSFCFDEEMGDRIKNSIDSTFFQELQYNIYATLTDDIDQAVLNQLCEEISRNHPEINAFIFLDRKDMMEVVKLGMERFELYHGRQPKGSVTYNPFGGI